MNVKEELKPHIIAIILYIGNYIKISEVKSKNPKCNVTILELSIKGYTMFTKSIETSEGRGIIIYTISTLQAEQINILTTFKSMLIYRCQTYKQNKTTIWMFV